MSKPCSIPGKKNLLLSASPCLWLTPRQLWGRGAHADTLPRHRIAGDTALDKNIHQSVSEQIKKNFAKSKWKVSTGCWEGVGGVRGVQEAPLGTPCWVTDAVRSAASLQRHGCGETHAEAAAGNQPGGPWANNSHQPRRAAWGGHQQR